MDGALRRLGIYMLVLVLLAGAGTISVWLYRVSGSGRTSQDGSSTKAQPLVLQQTVRAGTSAERDVALLTVRLVRTGSTLHADAVLENLTREVITVSSSDMLSVYADSTLLFPARPSGGGFGGDPIEPRGRREWSLDLTPAQGANDIRVVVQNWFVGVAGAGSGQVEMQRAEVGSPLSAIPETQNGGSSSLRDSQ